jgi:undecaprenyl-diphosphatase
MGLIEAVVLGVAQGLTEFLPISSTAHLRIIPALCGWADPGAPFTAVSQLGTLVAVLVYYRGDLARLAGASARAVVTRRLDDEGHARRALWILLATLPIVICGLAFKDLIETAFRSLYVIAGTLIFLSLLLGIAERFGRRSRDAASLRFIDTMLIGIAQAFALIPGMSRSGSTMTAGLFLHLRREDAASFSFLLSIPAVALSGLYQLYKLRADIAASLGLPLLVTVVVSGVVGYASIRLLLRFLSTHSTGVFIGYRIALGVFILILLSTSVLQP